MLAAKFGGRLLERVHTCSLLPGAKPFLANRHGHQSLHPICGTRQSDLDTIVARLGLTHDFDSIVGAPTGKRDAFLSILVGDQMLPHQALTIGDSMTELRAAQALRIPFIGIASPDAPDTFPAETVVLPNLAAADAMWNCGR
jgi:phosphoglycolate phosphatase-like HAD superfamily hydrolase